MENWMKARFERALYHEKFTVLAEELVSEGNSQVGIYSLFLDFLEHVSKDPSRERHQERIRELLDCVFYGRDLWMFSGPITNEDLREYRKDREFDEVFDIEPFGGEDMWMPTQACEEDACYDVRARAWMYPRASTINILGEVIASANPQDNTVTERSCIIFPGERTLVLTGVFVELKPGWEIQVRPRSGLAWKNAVTVKNSPGTVDARYRDEVGVILSNDDLACRYSMFNYFEIKKGDRIAQLAFRRVPKVGLRKVSKISRDLDRGGGFGHTGNH